MKKSRKKKENLVLKKALWFLYAISVVVVVVFSSYHLIYAKLMIPGVQVGGTRLGGRSFSEALLIIQRKIPKSLDLKLTYNGRVFDVTAKEVDLNYDLVQTARNAFKVGRSEGLFENTKVKATGFFKPINIYYAFNYSGEKLDEKLNSIAKEIETPHKDAYFSIAGNGTLVIIPEEIGTVVDRESVKGRILENVSRIDFTNVVIKTSTYEPAMTQADLEATNPKLENLISNLPMFIFQNETWRITKNDFLQMVTLTKEGGKVLVSVDKEKVKKFVTSIAKEVNRPPKSEIFKVEGEKVVDFRLPTPGYVVKEHAAVEIFSLALLDLSMERQIDLPAEEFMPSAGDNSYGIKELIGEGASTFFGSAPGRVFNIGLASKNLNGILIAPGETFSFNAGVGPIDFAHGFTSAYVISKGRTVLGEGGGVCQVSTTLFRAILNSGLPVVSRTAHAYRVGYYEQDKPVGFDATVYQPTVDFKFKNDTKNYVLVQSEVIPKESKLFFRLYGTKDGRVVKSLESKIISQTPPPETLYQDDPSLPKGTVQQVDWSAWGAVVELKRRVEKEGKVLYEDTFISNYQPWRAIYLVGTAE